MGQGLASRGLGASGFTLCFLGSLCCGCTCPPRHRGAVGPNDFPPWFLDLMMGEDLGLEP